MNERELVQTEIFQTWLSKMKDHTDRQAILRRLSMIMAGSFGDVKPVGSGISECRIHSGPGYRIYLTQRGPVIVILLCGGSKRTQAQDIMTAKALKEEIDNG